MYDRLSIRRIPTFAGLILVLCALLLSAGAVTPAFASERSTGQEEVRFQQSVVRQQMTPTISIASDSTYVAGLADLEFTLTREGDLTDSLRVIVEIEQDQTWLSATFYSVTFEAGEDETELTLAANIFSTEIMEDGELTASIDAVSGYDVSNAEVTVDVVHRGDLVFGVFFEEDSYEFDEDEGDVTVTLVARGAVGVTSVGSVGVNVTTDEIEASSGPADSDIGDYAVLSPLAFFADSDFEEVEGQLVSEEDLTLTIKDDQIYEGDETFGIQLSLPPGVAEEDVGLIGPDGNICGRICDELYIVTIKDDEPLPALKLSHTTLTVEEGSSGTYTAVLVTQPTDDVTVTPSAQGLTFDPTSRTFTAVNWETAQEFEVSAAEDDDKTDSMIEVTHGVSGGGYDDATVPMFTVTVTDDDKTVPSAPQNLRAIGGGGKVILSWDAPADSGSLDIAGYEYKVGSGMWTSTGGTDTEYTVLNLTNGTTYEFYIRARNTLGAGAEAGPVQADPQLPALKLSRRSFAVGEGDSDTYTVVLVAQPTDDVTVTPSGQGLTFDPTSRTFTAVNWETAQEFEVTAEDDADKIDTLIEVTHGVSGGGYDSAAVPEFFILVLDDDKTVPSAPLNLTAVPDSMKVHLSWDLPADLGGHNILGYEYRVGSGEWTSTGSTDTRFTVSGLTNKTAYEFYVRALNTLGAGDEAGPFGVTPFLPAASNFRVLNGNLSNGTYVLTSRAPRFDWDVPDEASGVRLGRYWVRPGHTCPEGSDPDRHGLGEEAGRCPVLYLWNEFGTRRTGWTDSQQAGGTFVYLLWMMDRDGEVNEPVEVTVEIPEQPYVQKAPRGVSVRSNITRGQLRIEIDWNRDESTRAFIIQWRESGDAYDTSQMGNRSHINAAGPPGSDGIYRYHAEGANPWNFARSKHQVDAGLEHNTLYYVRVGTCLVASCELDDVMWAPERAVRTPRTP